MTWAKKVFSILLISKGMRKLNQVSEEYRKRPEFRFIYWIDTGIVDFGYYRFASRSIQGVVKKNFSTVNKQNQPNLLVL